MKKVKFENQFGLKPNVLHFHGRNRDELPRTFDFILNEMELSNDYDKKKLAIVSTWTNENDCCLYQQCKKWGIDLINCVPSTYDRESKWYMPNKIHFFLNTLQTLEQEYVMFLDGYDVLLTDITNIIDKFEKSNYDIIYGSSCNNYPKVHVDVLYDRGNRGVYRFFNAGCCIGKREALIQFYTEALGFINVDNPLKSEQLVLRNAFAKYSNDGNQRFITIDSYGTIFQSMGVTLSNINEEKGTIKLDINPERITKIIVTGSEGFIGTELVNRLKENPNLVVYGVDKKSGGNADVVEYLIRTEEIDVVYHLGAQTSVFNEQHEDIIEDNIRQFVKIVDLCQKYGCKLVYTSSSTANLRNTTSLYGLTKRFGEEYAMLYCPTATGLRLHNVYGKNPRKDTLLWHLINHDTELYNNGENKRAFTYVDDVVEAILRATNKTGRLYNCVNSEIVTTKRFADMVMSEMERRNIPHPSYKLVETVRSRDNDVQEVNTNIPLIDIEYTPLAEGIKKCFEDF